MLKAKIAGAVVGLSLLVPMISSAATLSYPLFSNGQTSIDAQGNQTVSGTATLTVGSGEVVEWLRSQSDFSQPFTDTSVGGTLGYQEGVYSNVPFSVKVPPNTGTYNPTLQGAGTFGGGRSINGGDNVVFGPSSLGTIRVVANTVVSNPSTDVSLEPWQVAFNSLQAQIAALIATLGSASTSKPACPPSGSTTMVQSWLLSNGYAAGFNAAGVYAPTGFWGPITTSAYAQANAACK